MTFTKEKNMAVLERMVQTIAMDRWAELDPLDKKWSAVESRFGFPAKRRYQALAGAYDANTIIIERQWESMAEMEATYQKANEDPEYTALYSESPGVVLTNRNELYFVLS